MPKRTYVDRECLCPGAQRQIRSFARGLAGSDCAIPQINTPQVCQRWLFRRDSYVPAGERIDPGRHEVAVLDEADAKAFVERNHYSSTYPAARCRVGIFDRLGLAGVAVFSVPINQHAVPKHCGVPAGQGVELGRLVLLDRVPGNGETWFLARAFRALRRELPTVTAVLSYSDPVPRSTVDGRQVKPGHIGTIYQAHNARYLGRSRSRVILLGPDGRSFCERGLSKLRLGERGAGYVEDQLARAGAPRRLAGESGESYVRRLIADAWLRRMRHAGNHVYAWNLNDRGERSDLPYPKEIDHASQ